MTPKSSTHLTEEALNDVLIGLGSPESEAHLEWCAPCQSKLEAFQFDVRLFHSAASAWSQSRIPVQAASLPFHRARLRTRIAFVGWGTAIALLVVMVATVWRHSSVSPSHRAATAQVQIFDSEAQIAEDNELLRAVSAAISPDEEAAIDQYNLLNHPRSHAKAHAK